MIQPLRAAGVLACALAVAACRPVTTTLEVPIVLAKTPILVGPVHAIGGGPQPEPPESQAVERTLSTEHGQSSLSVDLERFGRYEDRDHNFRMGSSKPDVGSTGPLLSNGIRCSHSSFGMFLIFIFVQSSDTVCKSELRSDLRPKAPPAPWTAPLPGAPFPPATAPLPGPPVP